jgi:CheY-like chemotaxis protein
MRALRSRNLGNNIEWVKDGAEALDYLYRLGAYESRRASMPRLILLDLKMPKVDGLEVLRKIRADNSLNGVPVVMLTSSAEESDLVQSYDLGANSYIVKPVDFDKFVSEVSKLGFYWMVMNKLASSTT